MPTKNEREPQKPQSTANFSGDPTRFASTYALERLLDEVTVTSVRIELYERSISRT
jgi:hypothetical protein